MQLKIKQGVDLKKYGFVNYSKNDQDCYKVCSKDGVGVIVTVISGNIDFYVDIELRSPNTDDYYTLDDYSFDIDRYEDDVNMILCQEQELKDFATLFATLMNDNVIEVVKGETK